MGASPGGLAVRNPPDSAGDIVWSLGLENPLEKEMATQSTILAWEIPRLEETDRPQSMGSQELDTT